MKELPAKKTPLTEKEAAIALNNAWKDIFGEYPKRATLGLLWAQCALETGRWRHMWGYNFGNVKANNRYNGYCQYYRCSELLKVNGRLKEVWFEPKHHQTRFRAYRNAVDGAKDYVRFLLKNRYKESLHELIEGNVENYTRMLKKNGYFTASLNLYLKGMTRLNAEFHRREEELMGNAPRKEKGEDIHNIFSNKEKAEIKALVGDSSRYAIERYFSLTDRDILDDDPLPSDEVVLKSSDTALVAPQSSAQNAGIVALILAILGSIGYAISNAINYFF